MWIVVRGIAWRRGTGCTTQERPGGDAQPYRESAVSGLVLLPELFFELGEFAFYAGDGSE